MRNPIAALLLATLLTFPSGSAGAREASTTPSVSAAEIAEYDRSKNTLLQYRTDLAKWWTQWDDYSSKKGPRPDRPPLTDARLRELTAALESMDRLSPKVFAGLEDYWYESDISSVQRETRKAVGFLSKHKQALLDSNATDLDRGRASGGLDDIILHLYAMRDLFKAADKRLASNKPPPPEEQTPKEKRPPQNLTAEDIRRLAQGEEPDARPPAPERGGVMNGKEFDLDRYRRQAKDLETGKDVEAAGSGQPDSVRDKGRGAGKGWSFDFAMPSTPAEMDRVLRAQAGDNRIRFAMEYFESLDSSLKGLAFDGADFKDKSGKVMTASVTRFFMEVLPRIPDNARYPDFCKALKGPPGCLDRYEDLVRRFDALQTDPRYKDDPRVKAWLTDIEKKGISLKWSESYPRVDADKPNPFKNFYKKGDPLDGETLKGLAEQLAGLERELQAGGGKTKTEQAETDDKKADSPGEKPRVSLTADIEKLIRSFTAGPDETEGPALRAARYLEWATYQANHREVLAKRFMPVRQLLFELTTGPDVVRLITDSHPWVDKNKTPGLLPLEPGFEKWLADADAAIERNQAPFLAEYRALSQEKPRDRATAAEIQQRVSLLFMEHPWLEKYLAGKDAQDAIEKLGTNRGIAGNNPRLLDTELVRGTAESLSRLDWKPPPGWAPRTQAGKDLLGKLEQVIADLKQQLPTGGVLEDSGLGWRLAAVTDEGDRKALAPAVKAMEEFLAGLRRISASRDPKEVESLVRLAAAKLALGEEETDRAIAAFLASLCNNEKNKKDRPGTPDDLARQDRARRWQALSAKLEVLLRSQKAAGQQDLDEFSSLAGQLLVEFNSGGIKADLLTLEASDPEAFYLLADRMARIKLSSHNRAFGEAADDRHTSCKQLGREFEQSMAEIVKRRLAPGDQPEPGWMRQSKLAFFASLSGFPWVSDLAKREMLELRQEASLAAALDGTEALIQKYLDKGGKGALAAAEELRKRRDDALKRGDWASKAAGALEFLSDLELDVGLAIREKGKIEDEYLAAVRGFDDKMKALQDTLAGSKEMQSFKEELERRQKSRPAGLPPMAQDEVLALMAEMTGGEETRAVLADINALVQEHRRTLAALGEREAKLRETNQDYFAMVEARERFQNDLREFVASGQAPPGSFTLQTPEGFIQLENVEKGGKPVAYALDDYTPRLVDSLYAGGKDKEVKGYRVVKTEKDPSNSAVTLESEEFRSFDGRLVVQTKRRRVVGGLMLSQSEFFVNGAHAGSLTDESFDGERTHASLSHSVAGFDFISERESPGEVDRVTAALGDAAGSAQDDALFAARVAQNGLAQVDLSDIAAIADPEERRKAIAARTTKLMEYLKDPNYFRKGGGGDRRRERGQNIYFLTAKDGDYVERFLAHRMHEATAFGRRFSFDMEKGDPRHLRFIETWANGDVTVYTAVLSPLDCPSAMREGAEFLVAAALVREGKVLDTWMTSYRRTDPARFAQEPAGGWVFERARRAYVEKEVTIAWDRDPLESFRTEWGYQKKTEVFLLGPDGSAGPAALHVIASDFRVDTAADYFFTTSVKEVISAAVKVMEVAIAAGSTVWHGAVGTGKLAVGYGMKLGGGIYSGITGMFSSSDLLGPGPQEGDISDRFIVEGMANFGQAPLSRLVDHLIEVGQGTRKIDEYDPNNLNKTIYANLSAKEKNLSGGVGLTQDGMEASANTSGVLYHIGSQADSSWARGGLYAAGAFIDFGKGTVESLPMMFAGHGTVGLMRLFGAGTKTAALVGERVNAAIGMYSRIQAARGLAQLPEQIATLDWRNPEKVQAFLGNATGIVVDMLTAQMMKKPRGKAAAGKPISGFEKLAKKFEWIEGSGLEISRDPKKAFGLKWEEYAGGKPKGTDSPHAADPRIGRGPLDKVLGGDGALGADRLAELNLALEKVKRGGAAEADIGGSAKSSRPPTSTRTARAPTPMPASRTPRIPAGWRSWTPPAARCSSRESSPPRPASTRLRS